LLARQVVAEKSDLADFRTFFPEAFLCRHARPELLPSV